MFTNTNSISKFQILFRQWEEIMGNAQFMDIGQGRLAYEVTGEGPLVVCVPSMGDVRQEFRFLVPILAEAGFRVASMDLRGLGESSVEWDDYSVVGVGSDIGALIEHLRAENAFVVADSMGAGAAVYLAVERPELVRGMVLLDPFVRGVAGAAMRALITLLFADPWGPTAWKKYYDSLYPSRKPADFAAYLAKLSDNLREKGRMAALRRMMAASKEESERRLSRVRSPVLVLMGSSDPDFKDPESEARKVSGELRGAYRMIEGAGHYPHAEYPEETGALIRDFLNGLATEGAGRG
jgi:pimeloyl-ACP methyl ester carboxylesterase